jgi:hypothetical protein
MRWILRRMLIPPGRLFGVARLALVAMSAVVILSWLVTAIAHVDDGYAIDHVSGTWMALAGYANSGTLYPPLYDGYFFGGTRFMPVPILLEAAAARISDEYLVSGKTLSYLLVASLLVLTFVLLRRNRCPAPVALMLTSTILVTGTGLAAATSIRNDVLPVILQLGAIALVSRSTGRVSIALASALCAIAVVSKLSAVWAPLAIGIWLLRRDRRGLAAFAGCFVAVLAVALGAFQAVSGGRMADSIIGLSAATAGRLGSLHDQVARLRLIATEGLGALAVLPAIAILGGLLAARRRQLTLYHVAFACSLVATAVVLVDPGAYINHLLDVQVLSLIVVGELWRRSSPRSAGLSLITAAIVAALLTGSALAYRQNVAIGDDVRALVHGTTASRDRVPRLGSSVSADETILSEDPYISVSRGERPVVLDPFMLLSIAERHPRWRRELVGRIESRTFDKVIMLYVPESAPLWYSRVHFGEEIIRAIERSYRPAKHVDGYWIYVPR